VVAGRAVVVPDRETLAARAATIEARFSALGLPARKWLRMVRPFQSQAQLQSQAQAQPQAQPQHPFSIS
jgi:hypothetical protein